MRTIVVKNCSLFILFLVIILIFTPKCLSDGRLLLYTEELPLGRRTPLYGQPNGFVNAFKNDQRLAFYWFIVMKWFKHDFRN